MVIAENRCQHVDHRQGVRGRQAENTMPPRVLHEHREGIIIIIIGSRNDERWFDTVLANFQN
jgi:hypothetical protein